MAQNGFDVGHARRLKKIVEHACHVIDETAPRGGGVIPADVSLLEVCAGVAEMLVADFECILPKVLQFAALRFTIAKCMRQNYNCKRTFE